MFERFTEPARQVVALAQDEARALRHGYIGTEHLLLGLLREEEGIGARALESLAVSAEEVRAQVARIMGQGEEFSSAQLPFTPRAKDVLQIALREALGLGHNYIGTEHILLGLVRKMDGLAARILLDFHADAEKIGGAVNSLLPRPQTVSIPDPVERLTLAVERIAAALEARAALEFDEIARLRARKPTSPAPSRSKKNESE